MEIKPPVFWKEKESVKKQVNTWNFEDLKKKYCRDCVAVIPVHVGGHRCEMEKIIPWAKRK